MPMHVISLFFCMPTHSFTQAEFQETLDVSYATSLKYLQILAGDKERFIVRRKQPGRNRFIYACPEYILLLKQS